MQYHTLSLGPTRSSHLKSFKFFIWLQEPDSPGIRQLSDFPSGVWTSNVVNVTKYLNYLFALGNYM